MAKEATQKNTETKEAKTLRGVVVSTKMTDTATVEVTRYEKHPKYHKFVKTKKKYQAHDAGNAHNVGDKVEIQACRPVSKTKKFKVVA